LAAGLCIAAAVAIAVVLTIDGDETGTKIGFTAFALLLFGLTAAASTSVTERGGVWWLAWGCVAVSIAGFVVTTVMVWSAGEPFESEGVEKAFGSLLVAALALAQLSLLARPREVDSRRVAFVVMGARIAALLLAAMLIGAILGEVSDETYYRWVSVAWVLWLLGTALVPLSRRLAKY
jgi:hypothetical protein